LVRTRWFVSAVLCMGVSLGLAIGVVIGVFMSFMVTAVPAIAAEKVKLVVAEWGSQVYWDLHEQGIAEFEKLHPDIDIELWRTPGNDAKYWEQIMVRAAAGMMPDVFRVWSTQQTEVFRYGYAMDLTPLVQKDSEFFKQFVIPPIALDGKHYAIADMLIVNYLHFNEDLMKTLGLASPDDLYAQGSWDYQALENIAGKATKRKADGTPEVVGFAMVVPDHYYVGPWVQSFGGAWFDDNYSKVLFNQPAALEGLRWVQQQFVEGRFFPMSQYRPLVLAGQFGFNFNWSLPPAPGGQYGNTNVGYVPWPRGPQQDVSTYRTEPWAIAATTKHPGEAFEFVKYMASDGIRFMIAAQGKIPNYRPNMGILHDYAAQFKYGLRPLQEQIGKIVPQPMAPQHSRVTAILYPAFQDITEGKVAVNVAMEEAARLINDLFKWSN